MKAFKFLGLAVLVALTAQHEWAIWKNAVLLNDLKVRAGDDLTEPFKDIYARTGNPGVI